MYTVKYCPICKKDLPNPYCIPEYFIRCNKPKEHDIAQFVDTGLSENDFTIINDISEEPAFIESMIKLKESDPIEYQLKMSQFKANIAQQESSKTINDNKPKCPTCSSSNLKKVSTTSKAVNTVMFGLLGTKRYKTFHCNDCGYEW